MDAHHDLRDGVSNGSPVRRLIEHGLDPTRIVQVGIADFANSKAYSDRARTYGIRVISRGDVERRGITECVRDGIEAAGRMGGPVYVDLDLDVCDRAVAPGCPASAPGGSRRRRRATPRTPPACTRRCAPWTSSRWTRWPTPPTSGPCASPPSACSSSRPGWAGGCS